MTPVVEAELNEEMGGLELEEEEGEALSSQS